jgi:hypothetical protein
MQRHIEQAETADTDVARLQAYAALRQMIAWMIVGAEAVQADDR